MEKKNHSCRKGCGAQFARKNNRDRHEGRKSGCLGTQEVTTEKTVEEKTVEITVEERKMSFPCNRSWCNKMFNSKFNRDRHEETCVDKTNKNKCFICKLEFTRQTHLRRHMMTHTKVKQRFMRCSKCKVGFKRKDHLVAHEGQCNRKVA